MAISYHSIKIAFLIIIFICSFLLWVFIIGATICLLVESLPLRKDFGWSKPGSQKVILSIPWFWHFSLKNKFILIPFCQIDSEGGKYIKETTICNNNNYCFLEICYIDITALIIYPESLSFKIHSNITRWVFYHPHFVTQAWKN